MNNGSLGPTTIHELVGGQEEVEDSRGVYNVRPETETFVWSCFVVIDHSHSLFVGSYTQDFLVQTFRNLFGFVGTFSTFVVFKPVKKKKI